MLIQYSSNKKIVSPQLLTSSISASKFNDFNFSITKTSVLVSGSNTSSISLRDCNYLQYNNAIILNTGIVNVSDNIDNNSITTYYCPTSNAATIDSVGNISYISSGVASIVVKRNNRMRGGNLLLSTNSGITSSIFQSFVTGSLPAYLSNSIVNMTNGKTPDSQSYNQYSFVDDVNKQYTQNTNLWTSGGNIDLTCIPSSRDGQNTGRGILVSSDILITANHVGQGSKYYFVDNNNTVVSASVLSSRVADTSSIANNYDLLVVRFTQPITSSILPAKVLPYSTYSGSTKYMVDSISNKNTPVIYTNRLRTLCVGMLEVSQFSNNVSIYSWKPTNTQFLNWHTPITSGDSGNALLTSINGQTIALGCWYQADVTGGTHADCPNISVYINDINDVISKLGSTNFLTTASVSGFTTF